MIKFTAGDSDRQIIGVGLSHENLRRLKGDQPIVVDLAEMGIVGPPDELMIFAGETEAVMVDRLYALGAVRSDTEVHGS